MHACTHMYTHTYTLNVCVYRDRPGRYCPPHFTYTLPHEKHVRAYKYVRTYAKYVHTHTYVRTYTFVLYESRTVHPHVDMLGRTVKVAYACVCSMYMCARTVKVA
jgi:hypothetical protein